MTQVAVPTGYNKLIKRFAVRAVMMMMMSPTTKQCLRRRGEAHGCVVGRTEGPIYLLPNVLTGVTLSVMGERRKALFSSLRVDLQDG